MDNIHQRPIRILHAAYSLGIGGIETWLINLLREIDRQKRTELRFDFYLSEPSGCYEEEARSYGCQIFYAPPMSKIQKGFQLLGAYHPYRPLREIMLRGRYDVFHTHSVRDGGLQVKMAYRAGVPVRVVHCHCSQFSEGGQRPHDFKEKIRYKQFYRQNIPLIQKYATAITPCSSNAARFLLGDDWRKNPKCRVVYCGIALDRFNGELSETARQAVRKQFGVPSDALVVGHAGRMGAKVKNHCFLLKIFRTLYQRNKRYWLFLAGDGGLKSQIQNYAQELGVTERVVMPGNQPIVPLITGCFDVHTLPSIAEGMPIIGVEAVAGGLYTVCSDVITKDFTGEFPERVKAVPLDAPISDWADAIEEGIARKIPVADGCRLVEQSPFSIQSSLESLEKIYRGAVK